MRIDHLDELRSSLLNLVYSHDLLLRIGRNLLPSEDVFCPAVHLLLYERDQLVHLGLLLGINFSLVNALVAELEARGCPPEATLFILQRAERILLSSSTRGFELYWRVRLNPLVVGVHNMIVGNATWGLMAESNKISFSLLSDVVVAFEERLVRGLLILDRVTAMV